MFLLLGYLHMGWPLTVLLCVTVIAVRVALRRFTGGAGNRPPFRRW